MKLRFLINGSEGNAGSIIKKAAEKCGDEAAQKVISKSTRITNVLRNNALQVLSGTRSGRLYKRPGTTERKESNYYRASAPGEPPAVRTGKLRQAWNPYVKVEGSGLNATLTAGIESGVPYAEYLEKGTSKMAPRPYVDRIKEKAAPEIERILNE